MVASCMERVDKNSRVSLHPYQREGVEWMLQRELKPDKYGFRGGILADEMGLGKTVQMLSVINANIKTPTLILCPVTIVQQWEDHCKRYV